LYVFSLLGAPEKPVWIPKTIPDEDFYPPQSEEWKQELEKINQITIKMKKQVKIVPVFYKQEDAFIKANTDSQLVPFAYERVSTSREYTVKTYEQFWELYIQLDPVQRTFYEIIRENYPCYLYFDIEFERSANTETDGDDIMKIFINFLQENINECFDINTTRQDILELDSSRDR